MVIGARVDDPQCSTRWWWHGVAGVARPHRSSALHGYGAPFSVVFLPSELAGCEELTKAVFNWGGAPEQDTSWQGTMGWLTTRLGKTGAVLDVEHRHQVDEALERRTRCGDERGGPRVCFSFLQNSGSRTIYL
jgi:hypothetical protein